MMCERPFDLELVIRYDELLVALSVGTGLERLASDHIWLDLNAVHTSGLRVLLRICYCLREQRDARWAFASASTNWVLRDRLSFVVDVQVLRICIFRLAGLTAWTKSDPVA